MEKKDYFGQKEMELALVEIKNQIRQSNFYPEIIFSINRGGCIPGVYLSHLLNIPHHVIDIQLRDQKNNINISYREIELKSKDFHIKANIIVENKFKLNNWK